MKVRIKVPEDKVATIGIGNYVTVDFRQKPDPKEVTKRAIEYLDELFKPYLEGTKE